MTERDEFIALLRRRGTITSTSPHLAPLSGGVSSEIYLVTDGPRRFVLKRALAKLKVREDWFADVSRNRAEQAYLRHVGKFLPVAVPRLLDCHPDDGYFTMEFLGDGFVNWKEQLLAGHAPVDTATTAGQVLGTIHHHTCGQSQLATGFNSPEIFRQLRLDPYLQHTARQHPEIAPRLLAEADRLATTRDCLVHGDFSPKNMLVSPDRFVVLDCEVACFSDAVFDTAFLLNHFFLKSLHHQPRDFPLEDLVTNFWSAYIIARGDHGDSGLEQRTATLLPMLMLARVDGKSPAEYLSATHQQDLLRKFAHAAIREPLSNLRQVTRQWLDALAQSPTRPS